MEQPFGFIAQGESGLVCRLCRSLYSLKQSPYAWFERFSAIIQQFGRIHDKANHSIFYCHTFLTHHIYLIVYVEDIVITDNDHDGIQQLKQYLSHHFQIKDLDKLKYFLGIEVAQSSTSIAISQRVCIGYTRGDWHAQLQTHWYSYGSKC